MASLAGLLQLQGHRITGSDGAAYPPMSDLLAGLEIPVLEPYAEKNLDPAPDLVVIGNALSRGNPEIEYVLDKRIPSLRWRRSCARSFSRGASRWWLPEPTANHHDQHVGLDLSGRLQERPGTGTLVSNRRVAENFGTSFQLRPTFTFILEGDEYDTAFFDKGPKFLHYFPDGLILTSVEFDHADIYTDLEAVKTAFKRLVNLVRVVA